MRPIFEIERLARAKPDSLWHLPDDELAALRLNPPLDPIVLDGVHAETLVRCWLYRLQDRPEGLPQAYWDRLQRNWIPVRMTAFPRPALGGIDGGKKKKLFAKSQKGIEAFSAADGLIPVVIGDSSIAIPFEIRPRVGDESLVVDGEGQPVASWSSEDSWLHGSGMQLKLLVSIDESVTPLEGRSFGLPTYIAYLASHGVLDGPVDPLALIATGGLTVSVDSVAGVGQKRKLAESIGANFIEPANLPCTLDELPNALSTACKEASGGTLSAAVFLELLADLEDQIKEGTIRYEAASNKLGKWQERFVSTGILGPDALARAHVMRGSLLNHLGQPEESDRALHDALAVENASHLDLVDAMNTRVVMLADRGQIELARESGERLLEKIEGQYLNGASALDRARSLLKCQGALAAQCYLHLELAGKLPAGETRRLMCSAISLAQEIESKKDIAMDLAQLGFIDALLDPSGSLVAWEEIDARLASLGNSGVVSRQFHMRNRWLAAWRLFFSGDLDGIPADWSSFGFPSFEWLPGICAKYKGALISLEDTDAASSIFEEGIRLLGRKRAPFMQIMAAGVAVEGARVLEDRRKEWLGKAKRIFTEHADFSAPWHTSESWITYCDSIETGTPCDNPQRIFPY